MHQRLRTFPCHKVQDCTLTSSSGWLILSPMTTKTFALNHELSDLQEGDTEAGVP